MFFLILSFLEGFGGIPIENAIRTFAFALAFLLLQSAWKRYCPSLFSNWGTFTDNQKTRLMILTVSNVHILIIILFVSYMKMSGVDDYLAENFLENTSLVSRTLYSISAGYFLWDIYVVLTLPRLSLPFLAHGVGCFWVYWSTQQPNYQYFAARFLLFEASTIFLNARQWLVIVRGKKFWLLPYCEYGFAVSFFLVRLLYGFYIKVTLGSIQIGQLRLFWQKLEDNDFAMGSEETWFYLGKLLLFCIYLSLLVGLFLLNVFWFMDVWNKARLGQNRKREKAQ